MWVMPFCRISGADGSARSAHLFQQLVVSGYSLAAEIDKLPDVGTYLVLRNMLAAGAQRSSGRTLILRRLRRSSSASATAASGSSFVFSLASARLPADRESLDCEFVRRRPLPSPPVASARVNPSPLAGIVLCRTATTEVPRAGDAGVGIRIGHRWAAGVHGHARSFAGPSPCASGELMTAAQGAWGRPAIQNCQADRNCKEFAVFLRLIAPRARNGGAAGAARTAQARALRIPTAPPGCK